MLWHLLRQCAGLRAYYEPCHDNLLAHVQGNTPVQDSHYGVGSYWDEYRRLIDRLAAVHQNAFGVCRLSLEALDAWPELEAYLRALIDDSSPERAILQFNRMDFRLPWLKARFPRATVIHLFRNPRDEWFSITRGLSEAAAADPDENTNYDLVLWATGLSNVFPFLVGPHIRHSYERHYLLWKLSYLMGTRCADVTLSYDDDFCRDPARGTAALLRAAGVPADAGHDVASAVRVPPRYARPGAPSVGGLARMEDACDRLLARLGLIEGFGSLPVTAIRHQHEAAWESFVGPAHEETARLSALAFSRLRSRYLETVTTLRELGVNARNVEDELVRTRERLHQAIDVPARRDPSSGAPGDGDDAGNLSTAAPAAG